MAFKLLFQYLLILVLFLLSFQTIPTTQVFSQSSGPYGPREPHHLPYKPKENSTIHVIDLKKVSKSLDDSGYKIMSRSVKRKLPDLVPYGSNTTYDPSWYYLNNGVPWDKNLTLYDNNTVTVFAPPDNAYRSGAWISAPYQFVLSKFDQESVNNGLFSVGMKLPTCNYNEEYVVVTSVADEAGGVASINNVKITKWNIYNDGHLIVHGVEDYFHPNLQKQDIPYFSWSKETSEYTRVCLHHLAQQSNQVIS